MAELSLPVLGPPPPPPAATALVETGYENVRVIETGGTLTVWYENRRRPAQLDALAEVLALAAPLATSDATLALVPLHDDQPLLTLVTTPASVLAARTGRTRLEARVERPLAPPGAPLSAAADHSDVEIQPSIRFDQETYAYLARANYFAPLGNGLRLLGRLQAPVYPSFGLDPPRVALRSSGWMAPDFPAVFQVGWDDNRAHAAGEVGYQAFGGLGYLKLKGGLIQDRFPELVAKAEARIPAWDLSVGGGYGQWPRGDSGPFFTLARTFPRSRVEAGVYRTQYGTQFRATFGIDLGPDPRYQPAPVRLIPIGFWQITYLATAYDAAEDLEPAPSVDEFLDRLTPAYVEAHLDRLPWPAGTPQQAQ